MSALVFVCAVALGQIGGNVTLSCHTTKQNVMWQHDSEDVELSELAEIAGTSLILHDFQEDQMGNYTCLSEGEVIDYTYVLLNESWKFRGEKEWLVTNP